MKQLQGPHLLIQRKPMGFLQISKLPESQKPENTTPGTVSFTITKGVKILIDPESPELRRKTSVFSR